jgi:tetratricopeptide (TPR) repeat protein
VYRKSGRWNDAIQCYRRAIELLEKVPSQPQSRRAVCTFISFYAGLGDVQREAGQRVGAERSYRQALDLGNKYLVESGDQTSRASDCFYATWVSLGQLQIDSGKRQDARRTLQQARSLMEKLPQPNGEDLYNLARMSAQLSRLAGSGQTALSASEQAEHHRYLDQAVDALRKAIASGYRGLAELKKDTSLDPLRDRDDFQKLVAGLAAAKGQGRK